MLKKRMRSTNEHCSLRKGLLVKLLVVTFLSGGWMACESRHDKTNAIRQSGEEEDSSELNTIEGFLMVDTLHKNVQQYFHHFLSRSHEHDLCQVIADQDAQDDQYHQLEQYGEDLTVPDLLKIYFKQNKITLNHLSTHLPGIEELIRSKEYGVTDECFISSIDPEWPTFLSDFLDLRSHCPNYDEEYLVNSKLRCAFVESEAAVKALLSHGSTAGTALHFGLYVCGECSPPSPVFLSYVFDFDTFGELQRIERVIHNPSAFFVLPRW